MINVTVKFTLNTDVNEECYEELFKYVQKNPKHGAILLMDFANNVTVETKYETNTK